MLTLTKPGTPTIATTTASNNTGKVILHNTVAASMTMSIIRDMIIDTLVIASVNPCWCDACNHGHN